MRIVTVALAALLLAACGFHLRGQGALDDAWRAVNIRDNGKLSASTAWYAGSRDELARVTAHAFRDAGFTVSADAPVTIELLGESLDRRIASLDASASAAEYQLDYTLRFRVLAGDGSTLVPETTLAADRSYRYHDDQVMGSAEEEALLGLEMHRDIAAQIVRQYRRNAVRASAAAQATPAMPASDAPAP